MRSKLLLTYFRLFATNNSSLKRSVSNSRLRVWWFNSNPKKRCGVLAAAAAAVFGGSAIGFANVTTPTPEISFIEPEKREHRTLYDRSSVAVLPDVKIARKITSPVDTTGLGLRLYQYQSCPFCCKVRAFLDYYGFAYEVVEVNSVTRGQIKFSEYKKVPIIVAKGNHNKQMNDSSYIVSLLRSYMLDPSKAFDTIASYFPIYKVVDEKGKSRFEQENTYFVMFQDQLKNNKAAIENRKEEREWRMWVDQKFVHVISPNIYRTFNESLSSFRWFSDFGNWKENFSNVERLFVIYVGAAAMFVIAKRLQKKYGLKPDVRESLYDECEEWLRAKGDNRKFMGGERPNLADLAMYGVLTSFEGTAAFADMLKNTNMGPWFSATQEAVRNRLGAEELSQRLKAAAA